MELITTKIIALTLLGALTLFFGLIPLKVRKYLTQGSRKRERITSCCLCFGGGVLLATVFTHMLPETREYFNIAFAKKFITAGQDYPLAEVVVCAGFFLIYIVEEFVHKLSKDTGAGEEKSSSHSHRHHHHSHSHHHHHHGHNHNVHKLENLDGAKQLRRESGRCSVYSITEATKKGESAAEDRGQEVYSLSPKNKWAETGVDNPVFAGDADAVTWNPVLKETIVTSSQVVPSNNNSTTTTTTTTGGCDPGAPSGGRNGNHHHHAHVLADSEGHHHSHKEFSKLCSKGIAEQLRSIIIVLALSIHSVFEGLAVGLQERTVDVWYLFGAIAAHKFVIAFCIGIKLLTEGTSVALMVIYMVVLALVTPFGIAIGILVTESISGDPGSHLLLVTVLQGLAGGTILYVTFFEILERERARSGGRLLKLLFVLIGFTVMASMEAFGAHNHGPMGEGDHGGHAGHSHGGHNSDHHSVVSKTPVPDFLANNHLDHHDHDHNNNHFHVTEKPLADLVESGRSGFLTEPAIIDRLGLNSHEGHSLHDHGDVTTLPPEALPTTQEDQHKHEHNHEHSTDHNHEHTADHNHEHSTDHNHEHTADHNHEHSTDHNHEHTADHNHEHSTDQNHEHSNDHNHEHSTDHNHDHHTEHEDHDNKLHSDRH